MENLREIIDQLQSDVRQVKSWAEAQGFVDVVKVRAEMDAELAEEDRRYRKAIGQTANKDDRAAVLASHESAVEAIQAKYASKLPAPTPPPDEDVDDEDQDERGR